MFSKDVPPLALDAYALVGPLLSRAFVRLLSLPPMCRPLFRLMDSTSCSLRGLGVFGTNLPHLFSEHLLCPPYALSLTDLLITAEFFSIVFLCLHNPAFTNRYGGGVYIIPELLELATATKEIQKTDKNCKNAYTGHSSQLPHFAYLTVQPGNEILHPVANTHFSTLLKLISPLRLIIQLNPPDPFPAYDTPSSHTFKHQVISRLRRPPLAKAT